MVTHLLVAIESKKGDKQVYVAADAVAYQKPELPGGFRLDKILTYGGPDLGSGSFGDRCCAYGRGQCGVGTNSGFHLFGSGLLHARMSGRQASGRPSVRAPMRPSV